MNLINRFLGLVVAAGWLAAVGLALVLIWNQGSVVDWTSSGLGLNFDVDAASQSDQITASIIAIAIALPALLLLMGSLIGSRRSHANERGEYTHLQSRVDNLEHRAQEHDAVPDAPTRP